MSPEMFALLSARVPSAADRPSMLLWMAVPLPLRLVAPTCSASRIAATVCWSPFRLLDRLSNDRTMRSNSTGVRVWANGISPPAVIVGPLVQAGVSSTYRSVITLGGMISASAFAGILKSAGTLIRTSTEVPCGLTVVTRPIGTPSTSTRLPGNRPTDSVNRAEMLTVSEPNGPHPDEPTRARPRQPPQSPHAAIISSVPRSGRTSAAARRAWSPGRSRPGR